MRGVDAAGMSEHRAGRTLAPPRPPGAPPPPGPAAPPRRPWAARLVRGRPGDPAWARPALLALLAATALLYLWGLGASGWANGYYSAAVQAGASSWKAFLFGSTDAANFITVDKSPLFLWPMDLSARLFGVNAWAILVPQALEGVAAVGVLHLAVRRWWGPGAGLLAGTALALTPVAALMFRFNNPDAMLVLLLVLGAYATVRAVEHGATAWIVAAGAFTGLGFLAKMLQALLVVPAFGLAFLVAAPVPPWTRVRRAGLALAALVAAAGWWVALVELWPASSRPYVGGSQGNSVLELVFGYNGFGRLTGDEAGSVGGGPAGTAGRWGDTGLTRLFDAEFGGQIAWLLPAALVMLGVLAAVSLRAPRTDRTRATALLWGGWLLVTGLAISLGRGIIHPYYTVALAPAIGALVAAGAVVLWRRRAQPAARLALAGAVALTAWWSTRLLGRAEGWHPWLAPLVLAAGAGAAVAIAAGAAGRRRAAPWVAAAGLAACLAGPAAFALATAATPHAGALPSAGPAAAASPPGRSGGRGPGPGAGRRRGPRGPRACRVPRPGARVARGASSRPARRRPPSRPAWPRTGRPTAGWPPRSRPTGRPGTAWPPGGRSWPSAASTAPTRRPPWRSSRRTWPRVRSTGSSPRAAAPAPAAARGRRPPSRAGWRPGSPRSPSAA